MDENWHQPLLIVKQYGGLFHLVFAMYYVFTDVWVKEWFSCVYARFASPTSCLWQKHSIHVLVHAGIIRKTGLFCSVVHVHHVHVLMCPDILNSFCLICLCLCAGENQPLTTKYKGKSWVVKSLIKLTKD